MDILARPGNAGDVKTAPEALAEAPGRIRRRRLADEGYDADWLRMNLCARNTTPIIPGTRARKRKIRLDKKRYCERWRVVLRQAQDEGDVLPTEGFPQDRHPLRQARA